MKTEVLLVEQRALRCVEVKRIISLEVPVACRDPEWLSLLIAEQERDGELFVPLYTPVAGTESAKVIDVRLLGSAHVFGDSPRSDESGVGI